MTMPRSRMVVSSLAGLAGLLLSMSLVGCGSSESSSEAVPAADASTHEDANTQNDAQPDTGSDAGTDATVDSAADSGGDATADSAADSGGDATADSAADTGGEDSAADSASEASSDGASEASPDASSYNLQLWLEGNLKSTPPNDGYSGQTPSLFEMGISRFELLRTKNDSHPAVVFDYGKQYKTVNVLTSSEVGRADLANIPVDTYKFGRAKLDMVHFKVQTNFHPTLPVPAVKGTLDVLAALSDANVGGSDRNKGWAQYTFTFFNDFKRDAKLPTLPSTSAGEIIDEAHATYLLFTFDKPIAVMNVPNATFKATMILDVNESFRWVDWRKAGYLAGVFDTEESGDFEPVKNIGATGYHIKVELVH